jgi:putative membrane protein
MAEIGKIIDKNHTAKQAVSKVRLFFTGILMGIADLIPGVSGCTLAFACGIYEQLLLSMQTIRFHSPKKIAWPFLLPLAFGIGTSIALFSKLFYFLLVHYEAPLYAFFFGLTAATITMQGKKIEIYPNKPKPFLAFFCGFAFSFMLTWIGPQAFFQATKIGIVCAGLLGSCFMLLPGISGSFFLQVLGVYPLILQALATPGSLSSWKLLGLLSIGIILGIALFSHVIAFLLSRFRLLTLSVLVGFMAGGLPSLWRFQEGSRGICFFLALLGFFLIILLEMSRKDLRGAN